MHILRKTGKALLFLLLAALLVAPVVVIFLVSKDEQAQYVAAEAPILMEQSYGAPFRVMRTDMRETISLSGSVISTELLYQELDFADPYRLRLEISSGETMREGEVIGYYRGEPVLAELTGVVRQVSLGTDSYIQVESISELALECYADEKQLAVLRREGLSLRDADGNAYQVAQLDLIQSGNSGTRVLLTAEEGRLVYGQAMSEMVLETGRVFSQTLVIESQCVYRLSGDTQEYVRIVDAEGLFLGERKVSTSYTDGKYVCISGVEEGEYCDSGYKAVVESGGNYEGA